MGTVFAVVQIRLTRVDEVEGPLDRLVVCRESFVNVFGVRCFLDIGKM